MSRVFSIVRYAEEATEPYAEDICAKLHAELERAGGERYTPIVRSGLEVAEASIGYEFPKQGGVVNMKYSIAPGIMLALHIDIAGGRGFWEKSGEIPSAIRGLLDTEKAQYEETAFRGGWEVKE